MTENNKRFHSIFPNAFLKVDIWDGNIREEARSEAERTHIQSCM